MIANAFALAVIALVVAVGAATVIALVAWVVVGLVGGFQIPPKE